VTVALAIAKEQIIQIGKFLERQGWAAATSGNYSMRLDDGAIAVTVSGKNKGELTENDIMRVDPWGQAIDPQKPSAEMPLHLGLYHIFPHVNAVLHTHSITAIAITRLLSNIDCIQLQDYEMLKAYPGIQTHATTIDLPDFENTQNITALRADMEQVLLKNPLTPAFVIRNHGVYGWGRDLPEARRVIEATEYMLRCELEYNKYLP